MIAGKCNNFSVHWQDICYFYKEAASKHAGCLRLEIRQRKLKIITVIAAKRLVPKLMTPHRGSFTLMAVCSLPV